MVELGWTAALGDRRRPGRLGGRRLCSRRLDPVVAHGGRDQAGPERSGDLRTDPEAGRGASAPEERAERGRDRDGAELPQRCDLSALAPLEGRALLALAEVCAESPALGAGQLFLGETRDRELSLAARQAAFELFSERPPGAEEQALDGRDGDLQDLGYLSVGTSLELAHDESRPLVEAEETERAADLGRCRDLVVGDGRGRSMLVELDLARAA